MRRKGVQEYFRKLCDKNSSDQGKFCKTIKPYLNSRMSKNYARIVLKDNGKIITDHQELAETLMSSSETLHTPKLFNPRQTSAT